MSIHGYREYKPNLRAESILEASFNILVTYRAWDSPMTVRQIFYRLVAEFEYDKTEKGYKSLVNYIARSRRAYEGFILERVYGHEESREDASKLALEKETLIPFGWIRDEKGQNQEPLMYDDREEFVDHVRQQAEEMKLQRQEGQEQILEIWCEAQGMFPLMREIADPYGIRCSTGGGYDSVTAKHNLAQRVIKRVVDNRLPTVVLHIGDFDPSGEGMYETLRDDVTAMVADQIVSGANRWITVKRVALTEEQVIDMKVETAPPKPKDARSASFLERHPDIQDILGTDQITAQLEALTPPELRQLIIDQIETYFDEDARGEVMQREGDLREDLIDALSFEE